MKERELPYFQDTKQLTELRNNYPLIEYLDNEEEINHIKFTKWRYDQGDLIRPGDFEQFLIPYESHTILPQSDFMPDFDPNSLSDFELLAENLTTLAQNTARLLLHDSFAHKAKVHDGHMYQRSFETYKGSAAIRYHETSSINSRYLSIELKELVLDSNCEPKLFKPVSGKIYTSGNDLSFDVQPKPLSKETISSSYIFDGNGTAYTINDHTYKGATDLAEIMGLYESEAFAKNI